MYIRGLTTARESAITLLPLSIIQSERPEMPRTRAFKSGNSQAVRIPAEIAYASMYIDLEISRLGEVITIFPARTGLAEAVAALRGMPKPPAVEEREPIEVPLRRQD